MNAVQSGCSRFLLDNNRIQYQFDFSIPHEIKRKSDFQDILSTIQFMNDHLKEFDISLTPLLQERLESLDEHQG